MDKLFKTTVSSCDCMPIVLLMYILFVFIHTQACILCTFNIGLPTHTYRDSKVEGNSFNYHSPA